VDSFTPSLVIALLIVLAFVAGRIVFECSRRLRMRRTGIAIAAVLSLAMLAWMAMNGAPLMVLAIPAALPVGFFAGGHDEPLHIFPGR
jgi:NO-binding membrane sensor protein with MHYT domain